MIKNLIKLADHLDKKGLHKEADYVDWIIKSAQEGAEISQVQIVGTPKVNQHTRQDGSKGAVATIEVRIPFKAGSTDAKSLDGQVITMGRQGFDYPVGLAVARNTESPRDYFSMQMGKIINQLQSATGLKAMKPTLKLKYNGKVETKQLARAYNRQGEKSEIQPMDIHSYTATLGIAGGTGR